MDRVRRVGLIVAGVAAIAFITARFGLLVWLPKDQHPVRNVVEGLSWLAAIVVVLVPGAVFLARWTWARPASEEAAERSASDEAPVEPSTGDRSAGDRGVIIEQGVHGTGSGIVIGAVTGDGFNITPAPAGPTGTPDPSRPTQE